MPEMQQRSSVGGARSLLFQPVSSSPGSSSSSNGAAPPTSSGSHTPSLIPPWVHINTDTSGTDRAALLPSPEEILPSTRHYKPPPPHYRPGRKWDHLRTAEPAFLSSPVAEAQQRWKSFMYAGPNPRAEDAVSLGNDDDTARSGSGGAHIVDRQWMDEHMPDWNPPWNPADDLAAGGEPQQKGLMYKGMWFLSPERQERTVKAFWRILLKNAFVPLGFRLINLSFSAAALAISATIFVNVQRANRDPEVSNHCASRASTYMAIVVDTIAIPYITYVTWDEYMSKPLGLRSVAAKILLLLCDLFFIVFSASNLSLAFDALTDHRWACFDERFVTVEGRNIAAACPNNPGICTKQKILSSLLLVNLVLWLSTFSVSVMRVVEKLRPD